MNDIKINNSFDEIYTKAFKQRMEDENQIFNQAPKNMDELKKYVNKVLAINILKNNNKHYLSLGIEELIKIIKIAKKTVFDMIKDRQLDSVKMGKYRLIIFCIEDLCEYKADDVIKMLELPPKNLEFRLNCNFNKTSILKTILYIYEDNLKK